MQELGLAVHSRRTSLCEGYRSQTPTFLTSFHASRTSASRHLCPVLLVAGGQVAESGSTLHTHFLLGYFWSKTMWPWHRGLKLLNHIMVIAWRCCLFILHPISFHWEKNTTEALDNLLLLAKKPEDTAHFWPSAAPSGEEKWPRILGHDLESHLLLQTSGKLGDVILYQHRLHIIRPCSTLHVNLFLLFFF